MTHYHVQNELVQRNKQHLETQASCVIKNSIMHIDV